MSSKLDVHLRRYRNVPLDTVDEENGFASIDSRLSPSRGNFLNRMRWTRNIGFCLLAGAAIMTFLHVYQNPIAYNHMVLKTPFYTKEMVQFTTEHGTFTIELYPEHAQKTVEHFKNLVSSGFYSDGKTGFYQNEPNFLLQGGGFLSRNKSPHENVPVEYSLPSKKGMVVLARGDDAKSGNSEFAIMLADNSLINVLSTTNPGYTAFGRVVRGWNTIETISRKMKSGLLSHSEVSKQVLFDEAKFVNEKTHDSTEAKRQLERIYASINTKYKVILFTRPASSETELFKAIFLSMSASLQEEEMANPIAIKVLEEVIGTHVLPIVSISGHFYTLQDIQKKKTRRKSSSIA